MINSIKIFFQATAEKSLLITAVKVAIVVGVILNLINQGNVFIHFNFTNLDPTKFILTFFVPFGVSAYSSAKIRLKMKVGDRAKINAEIKCVTCGETSMEINEGDQIKGCINCGNSTKYKVIKIK